MKANANPDVVFQTPKAQLIPLVRHFSRVVEEHHVDRESIGNPAKLPGHQETVPVAKPPAGIRPQRAAAAERRHQEVRNIVAVVERRLHQPVQGNHPVLPKNRNVLHDLAVHPIEAVGFVLVGVVVIGDGIEPATTRVTRSRPPVHAGRGFRVQVFRVGAQTRGGVRREGLLDRRRTAGTRFKRVVLVGHARAKHRVLGSPKIQVAADVALLHAEIRLVILEAVSPEAVVGDLGRVSPTDAAVKIQAASILTPRIGAELDELVVLERIQALQIPMRAIAEELAETGAERETAAAVDAREIGVKARGQFDEHTVEAGRPALSRTRDIWFQGRRFLRLFGPDNLRA